MIHSICYIGVNKLYILSVIGLRRNSGRRYYLPEKILFTLAKGKIKLSVEKLCEEVHNCGEEADKD